MLFRFGDASIKSNIPLGIACANQVGADRFHFFARAELEPTPCHWIHHHRLDDGEISLSLGKSGSGYLLRFPQLADFLVADEGREIHCCAGPAIPLETIRHLFLDQVMPLVLSNQGRLVLHAGAVQTREGAIAFLGRTGWGKSTLTASFWQEGFPVLTDDCLILAKAGGKLAAHPSYSSLRLWPDSQSALFEDHLPWLRMAHYTQKLRLDLDREKPPSCPDPVPLRRLYILSPPGETENRKSISITPVSPREAFLELVRNAYRLDITDQKKVRKEFESLGWLTASLEVRRLSFPRDFPLLDKVRRAILTDLSVAPQEVGRLAQSNPSSFGVDSTCTALHRMAG